MDLRWNQLNASIPCRQLKTCSLFLHYCSYCDCRCFGRYWYWLRCCRWWNTFTRLTVLSLCGARDSMLSTTLDICICVRMFATHIDYIVLCVCTSRHRIRASMFAVPNRFTYESKVFICVWSLVLWVDASTSYVLIIFLLLGIYHRHACIHFTAPFPISCSPFILI